eukprot:1022578-Amphidinium_carterae.1
MVAQLKGIPLEYGEFGDMPLYWKVPVTHRARRFQLGKLAIILKELKEEEEAALRNEEVADEADSQASLPPMSTLPIPSADSLETGTVADGLSPRNLDDVQLDENEAQIAANQSADGSAASASEAIASAVQRRAQQKISQKSQVSAMSSMATVQEEAVPPSDPDSYRSAVEEADAVEDEQSEPPEE